MLSRRLTHFVRWVGDSLASQQVRDGGSSDLNMSLQEHRSQVYEYIKKEEAIEVWEDFDANSLNNLQICRDSPEYAHLNCKLSKAARYPNNMIEGGLEGSQKNCNKIVV